MSIYRLINEDNLRKDVKLTHIPMFSTASRIALAGLTFASLYGCGDENSITTIIPEATAQIIPSVPTQEIIATSSPTNTVFPTPTLEVSTPTPTIEAINPISTPKIINTSPTSEIKTTTVVSETISQRKNPIAGEKLWVNPNSDVKQVVAKLKSEGKNEDAKLLEVIANQPSVIWLGNWNSNVEQDVRNTIDTIKNDNSLPIFVIYNIPKRDNSGNYSKGGASSPEEYKKFIQNIADGIGDNKALIIFEPDALADLLSLSKDDQNTRLNLMKEASSILKTKKNLLNYIDAGHLKWRSSKEMADLLTKIGLNNIDGFTLNISNFFSTLDNIAYGTEISKLTNGLHFIIDTGRNGNGPTSDNQWCNPPGRALGNFPTTNTGNPLVDAYLWIHGPAGSDGNCNGGPNAGDVWVDNAKTLVINAGKGN